MKLELTRSLIAWTKDYFKDNAEGKAIIGISGGKDSTICAAILKEAIGSDRIIAVMMPNTVQTDIADSYRVCDYLGIPNENRYVINIGSTYQSMMSTLVKAAYLTNFKNIQNPLDNDLITTNLPARLRMCTLYAIAACYPGSRVCNTSNLSERFIGYSTKFGDSAGDFSILGNVLVSEVLMVGDDLNIPYDLVHKTPADGMSGQSDEEKIGIPYSEIDKSIQDDDYVSEYTEKISRLNMINAHKTSPMPMWRRFWNKEFI